MSGNKTGVNDSVLAQEPALSAGAITFAVDAIINLLISFHVLDVTGDQVAQINIALGAVLALAGALFVRGRVSPVAASSSDNTNGK